MTCLESLYGDILTDLTSNQGREHWAHATFSSSAIQLTVAQIKLPGSGRLQQWWGFARRTSFTFQVLASCINITLLCRMDSVLSMTQLPSFSLQRRLDIFIITFLLWLQLPIPGGIRPHGRLLNGSDSMAMRNWASSIQHKWLVEGGAVLTWLNLFF